jgi:hypothetical protein
MKDNMEDFIKNNRQAFDSREPSGKVWDRIERTLPRMKSVSLWNSIPLWRSAALVLLGLSAFLLTNQYRQQRPAEAEPLQREFNDIESFYNRQIDEKVSWIEDNDASGDHDQFTQDLQKLDAMYQVLRDDMKNHPNKKLKDALILNFLVRLDLLNQQIKKLEDSDRKEGASVV